MPRPDFGPLIDARPLLARERADLLALLRSLSEDEWWAAAVCGGWSVHDVALHLLGADLNVLSSDRAGGGQRVVESRGSAWVFRAARPEEPDCLVRSSTETAWQAFTLGLTTSEQRMRMTVHGPAWLADPIVDMVSIIG